GDVVRDAKHALSVDPLVADPAVVMPFLDMALEAHLDGVLDARDLPRVAVSEPGVTLLDLFAVLDTLLKDPVFVPDAVTEPRQGQGRHRVQKAGRQAAQAAVAETGIRFLLQHVRE